MLLFDNYVLMEQSSVWEFNPVTEEVYWHYRGNRRHPFYSEVCGTTQRLPNGNTLITESDNGRVFEVTRDKEIVWEFYNPHRAGENREYIAMVPELVRLPPEFPQRWPKLGSVVQTGVNHTKRTAGPKPPIRGESIPPGVDMRGQSD